jgi:hypothetical protein
MKLPWLNLVVGLINLGVAISLTFSDGFGNCLFWGPNLILSLVNLNIFYKGYKENQ